MVSSAHPSLPAEPPVAAESPVPVEPPAPAGAAVEPAPRAESGRAQLRVLYVLTAPFGLDKTLGGQLRYLKGAGFEPWFACSPGEELERFAAREGVRGEAIPIEREISPLRDLRVLWRLWRLMRRLRPAITNVSAPKAGLLGGLAAWLAAVPCRVYTLRGLRLETARGAKYRILWAAEWMACRLAHRVVCVSRVLARCAIELGLAPPERVVIPGPGSSNGVDAKHFEPDNADRARAEELEELRRRWSIPSGAAVLGFVGRFTQDKGIAELVAAYYQLRKTRPQLRLLLVGCFEAGDPVPAVAREAIENDPNIIVTGFLDDPALVYQLLDVVALPTYREGYPTVALEAAAACRPFVTTSATGAVEAVEHGVTGLLAPPGDSRALAAAVASLLDDPEWAAEMASRARLRVVKEFSQQRIWEAIASVYRDLLRENQRNGAAVAAGSAAVCSAGVGSARVGSVPDSAGWALGPGKRAFDVVLALVGLAVGGPLLLVSAAVIAATMGRPILFRQPRLGFRGRRFEMFKLRTMSEARGREGAPEAERLTPAGRLLRRWSLDELPQLWNVLRGEMSLVGPRPLPPEYFGRYSPRQRRRHEVKPGLTGWAQVAGRNALTWEQRFELDLWYAEHASLALDLRILARSFRVVLSGVGVSPPGAALMPEFLGDQHDPA